MSKVKIELNLAGFRELYKSQEIIEALLDAGDEVVRQAEQITWKNGSEYAASAHMADKMAIVNVYPNNRDAAIDNYLDNVLVKAVGMADLPTKKPRL